MNRSRIAALWVALAAVPASGAAPAAPPDARPVLRILNWSDYIDLDETVPAHAPIPDRSPSLRRFQREAGCRIEYFEFDEAVEMNARVMNMPGFFDVVMVSQDDAGQMIRAGLTRALPAGRFEGPGGLISGCVPFGTANGGRHFLPYLVGVLGLAVRTDAGRPRIGRWADVFDPQAGTAPRIGLTACPFEQTYAALKWQGRSLSTTNREELAAAVRALGRLRKSGRLAVTTSDMNALGRALVGDRADAVMMYSTDARALIDENPGVPIRFVVPAEGAELYIDGWVVMAASRQPDLAVRFVEFMATPGIHADVAGWLGARPATTAAMAELRKREPDFEKSPTLAPPPDASGNCEAPSVVAQDIVPLWTGVMATPLPAGPKP